MNAPAAAIPWTLPSPGRVGMYGLIAAESAIFVIFVVAYLFYVGKSVSGPTPEVLHTPIIPSICLLSSSWTMHSAVAALRRGDVKSFRRRWLLTFVLGALFLGATAGEWRHLIGDEGLTIRTNLFGTTYYSLVGLHAFHVTVGLVVLAAVWLFSAFGRVAPADAERVSLVSMYWHFVDAVWVVVFSVVYVIGR
jgi:cytochrome c oxidase subunit 3